ncbi:ABC transporter permease [Arthrobacter sp. zg-Y820]|uniref:ABC transporter permease n=1 Tax=unclassified Arthrobacter TaxID=235627 RepID=UPI001E2989C5|nr:MULTISPECIES: ABC transporter permease [unclassified Arthrobacter]MCC9195524.1 ABC transporter permease [Arthrobacter sp. zg-Y820]MDK1278383.1 ABC transporter permease [Arthrobacter sp. zg.Y820]WIB11060.1 ABC transporter permease [Arthrobacter sp. zg-Y820]
MPPPAVPVPDSELHPESGNDSVLHRIVSSNALVSVLSVVMALIVGGLLIALTNEDVASAASYFFSRPSDLFAAAWSAASGAYIALFQGSVFNFEAQSFSRMIYPLTQTLTVATPLICAGLGVALAFRAGLFNIGAQGQILIGATMAAWVGFSWHLPAGLHLLVVVIAGALGGALWGGIAGLLKARTGAHEVIVTIMLNYIAIQLVLFLLTTPGFQRPGSTNPISPQLDETAMFPPLLGSGFRLHWGFVMAVAATVFIWWLLNRSTVGFELRAVGANPAAARNAGISTTKGYVIVMLIAGALAGLAGVAQVSGTEKVLTSGVAASFGFDAITVALLGRSSPWGTFAAGILFGAFRAGGVTMQTSTGTNIDIVLVVQSLIVLFIAAPPLVRSIFRIPPPGAFKTSGKRTTKNAKAAGGTA